MSADPSPADIRTVLATGELTLYGQITGASNLTLVCDAELGGTTLRCVYKPVRGETPLWDFPDGTLAGREVASYLIDEALGWNLIPETVLRDQGPDAAALGPGSLQRWIDQPDDPVRLDPVEVVPVDDVPDGYRAILRAHDDDGSVIALAHATDEQIARLAVLDVVLNNADRKGGHILVDADGEVFGIDHGICLHAEPKLRTLLWGWAGEKIPDDIVDDLRELGEKLAPESALATGLAEHLTPVEVDALRARIERLVESKTMPSPPHERAIPWPPF